MMSIIDTTICTVQIVMRKSGLIVSASKFLPERDTSNSRLWENMTGNATGIRDSMAKQMSSDSSDCLIRIIVWRYADRDRQHMEVTEKASVAGGEPFVDVLSGDTVTAAEYEDQITLKQETIDETIIGVLANSMGLDDICYN